MDSRAISMARENPSQKQKTQYGRFLERLHKVVEFWDKILLVHLPISHPHQKTLLFD